MTTIRDATEAEITQVLAGTHPLWSDGLDPRSYERFVRSMMAMPWSRAGHYRFLVMEDPGGEPACAMKLYRLEGRLGGARVGIGGVGAVFTFPRHRRRGHAARMIEQAHALMRRRGDAVALLHSEIGGDYYARLGYRPLDPEAVALRVPAAGAPASDRLRVLPSGAGEGLDALMALRRHEDSLLPFALERSPDYWSVLLARAETPERLLGRDRWESRLALDPRGGFLWSLLRAPGSAPAHDGGAAARVLEFAEQSPGASLPDLLDDLFAACRSRGIAEIESWRGRELARRDARLADGGDARPRPISPPAVIPMWKPLAGDAAPEIERVLRGAPLHLSEVF